MELRVRYPDMTPPQDDAPGNPSEPVERYQAELRADPRSLVFVPLAIALFEADRYQEAVDVCRRGLAAHPDAVEARLVLARACLKLKRPADAIVELTKLLKQDPNGRETLLLLGAALLERGDANRAQQALQRASSIYPDDAEVTALLTTARERLGPAGPPVAPVQKPGPASAQPPAPGAAKPAAAAAPPAAKPAGAAAPPAAKPTAAA
ncbi:MAG: tetratricopeptide repeat protein, partial [Deltaproteobacteria bacterium]|nr:tetratricopeptide repeat protein [Deltaproteobacteria bacterium]